MKHSLNYLPAEKRRDLEQLTQIIREEVVGCVMIILYGSYARGTFIDYDQRIEFGVPTHFMSDYDILIVTEKRLGINEYNLYAKINRRFFENKAWEIHTHPQFINESITELNRQLDKRRYFYTDIKKQGVMLYNSGQHQLARRRKLNYSEIRTLAQEYFEDKFNRGSDFLEDAITNIAKGKYKHGSFHLHQATENFLRTIPMVFVLYGYKDHDLEVLMSHVKKHTLEVGKVFPRDTPEEKRLFELLQAAYVQARYNKDFTVTQADMSALLPRVELLRTITSEVSLARISEYDKLR